MILEKHIQQAVDNAVVGNSNLSEDVLAIRGFSTKTIRNIFGNLCNTAEPITYLEVGLFCGASFCASFNKNCTSIGVEDHSQDFSAGFDLVKKELKENVEKFKGNAKEAQVIYADCFAMDKSLLPDNIDVYFYDGWHSEEHQRKALPYFLDKMANKFIWVVDDFNWDYVKSGTDLALADLKDKIQVGRVWLLRGYHLQNDPIYHNGLAIYLINKK